LYKSATKAVTMPSMEKLAADIVKLRTLGVEEAKQETAQRQRVRQEEERQRQEREAVSVAGGAPGDGTQADEAPEEQSEVGDGEFVAPEVLV
jgi:hypothetical protein